MEEANAFPEMKPKTAKTIAYAAFLCILSPIGLFILGTVSQGGKSALKPDMM